MVSHGCVDLTDNEYEMLASHKLGTIHWYCTTCNIKSVELLRLVFGLQDRIQETKSEIENMKRETGTLKMHDLKMTDKENYGSGKCKSGK